MKKAAENISAYPELCKLKISLFASLSAASGFVLASSGFKQEIFVVVFGVFMLASGAAALNQYQERATDALMPRTKRRPLPSGRIKPGHALFFSIMLISLGLLVLLLAGNMMVPLLGLTAVFWYNGAYAYLKKRSAFAAVPGALVGAIPPAMGSIAGGGRLGDPAVIYLCFFFFVWQVPHFWLLIVDRGEEYRNAGLPSMTGLFTSTQLARIIFVWICATAVSCLFVAGTGVSLSPLVYFLVFASSLWIIASGIRLLHRERRYSFTVTFRKINVYMFLVMTLLSADRLILSG